MDVTFPGWVKIALVVAAAGISYALTQTTFELAPVWTFGLGLANVIVATLLAAQNAVTRTVRRMSGRPR